MQQKLSFRDRHGHKICAVISKTGSDSIVLLIHGLNSSKDSRTNLELEKVFLQNDIDVMRIDLFGHGESEGRIEERSVDRFVGTVLSSISHVNHLGYRNVGIFGSSFGGVASVIAASGSHAIKVLALKAPGMGQTSRNMEQYRADFDARSWITAGRLISMPSLIVHGTDDKDVEVKFGEELAHSIDGSALSLYPGTDHMFSKPHDFDKMIAEISAFIVSNLKKMDKQ